MELPPTVMLTEGEWTVIEWGYPCGYTTRMPIRWAGLFNGCVYYLGAM